MPDLLRLTRAVRFVAEAHANHRRKGAAQEPYINHLVEVADLVACATDGTDDDLIIAALCHDTIEDTGVTEAELADRFGLRVAGIVAECSDDMRLPKDERRRLRIEGRRTIGRRPHGQDRGRDLQPALHGRLAALGLAAGVAPALRRRDARRCTTACVAPTFRSMRCSTRRKPRPVPRSTPWVPRRPP